ncbi:MAG: proprotein convertase P-domain-containing protein [Deltaproteobacteria bacterium]|nr:proprotein convertase P-domain-containing protein [Deltaproteobacteria bacterium]
MEKIANRIVAGLLAGAVSLTGCAADGVGAGDGSTIGGGKEDRWNEANRPDNFDGELRYRFADLPTSGHAERTSWPSTYWPTYQDSINHRWNGGSTGTDRLSPAEKYDLAFNGWTPSEAFYNLRPFASAGAAFDREYYDQLGPLARYVSTHMGNADSRDGVDSDGDGQIDEADDNDGVATWWGLCHAWVPASMLENQPGGTPVTINGVTFYSGDLEALMIAAYNRSGAQMIGDRCNDGGRGTGSRPVERDEHGRAVDPECRDTNAGAFHVIMANYLGIMHRPLAEDRTYDFEVWNQPVVSFEVTKSETIDLARANQLLGVTGDSYTYNTDAVSFVYVESTVTYITESHAGRLPSNPEQYKRRDHYTYILELDADGNVIGGEWTGSSRSGHPDFLWNPSRLSRSSTPYLDLDRIRDLVEQSRGAANPGGGTTGEARAFDGTAGMQIPDNDPAGITATATVPDAMNVSALSVELNVTHTYVGDLRITLSHGGTERVLHDNEGGSDDDIARTIPVSGFEGQSAQGDWTLRIVDGAGQDVGTLVSWRVLVTPNS